MQRRRDSLAQFEDRVSPACNASYPDRRRKAVRAVAQLHIQGSLYVVELCRA